MCEFGVDLTLAVERQKYFVNSLHQEVVLLLRDGVPRGVLLGHGPQQLPVNGCDMLPTGVVHYLLLLHLENGRVESEIYI